MIKIDDKGTEIKGSLSDIIPEIIGILKSVRDVLSKCGFDNNDSTKLLKLAVKVSKYSEDELKSGCGVEEMAVIAKLAVDRIAEKFTKD